VDLVRRPASVLAAFALGIAALVLLVGAPLAVAAVAWSAARDAFAGGRPIAAVVAVAVLSAAWVTGLCLAGAASAWRRVALATAVAAPEAAPEPAAARRPEAVAG